MERVTGLGIGGGGGTALALPLALAGGWPLIGRVVADAAVGDYTAAVGVGVPAAGVVIAVVQATKLAGVPSKYAALMSVGVGVGYVCLVHAALLAEHDPHAGNWANAVAVGLSLGLAASGLYSGTKAVITSRRKPRPARPPGTGAHPAHAGHAPHAATAGSGNPAPVPVAAGAPTVPAPATPGTPPLALRRWERGGERERSRWQSQRRSRWRRGRGSTAQRNGGNAKDAKDAKDAKNTRG